MRRCRMCRWRSLATALTALAAALTASTSGGVSANAAVAGVNGALSGRLRGREARRGLARATSSAFDSEGWWANEAMGESESKRAGDGDDDSDDHDSSHLQMVLGLSLGGAILALTVFFTWRAWLECCMPSHRPPRHRAFQRQSTSVWKCGVCLHSNDGHQRCCVLCGSMDRVSESSRSSSYTKEEARAQAIEAAESHAVRTSTAPFFLLPSPLSNSAQPIQESRQQPVRARLASIAIDERQRVAIDRHAWKRCIVSKRVQWIRIEYEDVQQYQGLQGTILTEKNMPLVTKTRRRSRRSMCPSESFKSVDTSCGPMDSNSMGLFTLTSSTGFVRDDERHDGAVWKLADDFAGSARKYSREILHVAGLPFAEKAQWLYQYSLKVSSSIVDGFYTMRVSREHVLDESVTLLSKASAMVLRRRLRIDFQDEPGVDGGGILREWLELLCKEIFADTRDLFVVANSSQHHGYWIKRTQDRQPYRMLMFKFFGKILGKAILEGLMLNVRLSVPLMKHILGVPFGLEDLRLVDETIYASLVWILQNDNASSLGLNFTVEGHKLIPNGDEVELHEGNKHVYVAKVLQYYLFDSVNAEIASLLTGLRSVIDDTALHVFDYKELDLILSGLPSIDVVDWRKHSEVALLGGPNPALENMVIEWFWQVVEGFTQDQQSRLLQYVTGSSGVPVEGFKGLTGMDGDIKRFTIKLTKLPPGVHYGLPHASTCLNRLDLPVYASKEELEESLAMVIQMDVTGFSSR